jgi:hypothetical protein
LILYYKINYNNYYQYNDIYIYINNILNDILCSINNYNNYTGKDLKQQIYEKTNIEVDKQKLIFNDKIISDNDIIENLFNYNDLYIIIYLIL